MIKEEHAKEVRAALYQATAADVTPVIRTCHELLETNPNPNPNPDLRTCCEWLENNALDKEGVWRTPGSRSLVDEFQRELLETNPNPNPNPDLRSTNFNGSLMPRVTSHWRHM